MNPNVTLYDENELGEIVGHSPAQTVIQKHLWSLYEEGISNAFRVAEGDEIILLHLGDATHGVRFPSELVTTSVANQVLIALANIRPWLTHDSVRRVRLVAGTDVHEFGESSATHLIAAALRKEFPEKDIKATKHSLLDIGGYLVDAAHHGPPPGSRSWLTGNIFRFYLRDLIYQERAAGKRPPNLVLRAHYHTPLVEIVDAGSHFMTGVILPSFSYLTNHARKAARSVHRITHGTFAFRIKGGRLLDLYRWTKTLDIRTKEVIDER